MTEHSGEPVDSNTVIRGGLEAGQRPDTATHLPVGSEPEYGGETGHAANAAPAGTSGRPGTGPKYTGTMPDDPEEAKHYRPDEPADLPYSEDQDQFADGRDPAERSDRDIRNRRTE